MALLDSGQTARDSLRAISVYIETGYADRRVTARTALLPIFLRWYPDQRALSWVNEGIENNAPSDEGIWDGFAG